ncbi:MAG: LPS assembly lipoprotein LptE [Gammaproteobacteria bacterium]|nr:LPS assembly lipoprotein LptE [Gammaproteobacteria bacterium]
MPIRSLLLVVLAFSLLQGCGFHLRGQVDLPSSMSELYIKIGSGYPGLERELTAALRENGVEVLTSPSGSSSTLDLFDVLFERDLSTLDTRGKVSGYALRYLVQFRVTDPAGEVMLEGTRVRARRDFEFESTQVLQSQEEQDFLRESMERELALQILRRLSAIAAAPVSGVSVLANRGLVVNPI